MPAIWFRVKKSIYCKSEQADFHEPRGGHQRSRSLSTISTKKSGRDRCGCSRSIANLKDVMIHGSKRHTPKPTICSPRSIGSSELLNPITHEVVLSDSTCELKIRTAIGGDSFSAGFEGTLKPGTPGPGRIQVGVKQQGGLMGSPIRRTSSSLSRRSHGFVGFSPRPRSSFSPDSLSCQKCGEQFVRWEAVEEHHLYKHAVTELTEGESSRRIVEIICRTTAGRSENGIERILKVHNMQKTLAQFEEYREVVKIKASKLSKKHPRCLADGNELLRFHGAAVECRLGVKGSSSLCISEKCRVCRILRYGFSTNKKETSSAGVFTAATSTRALESIQNSDGARKALVVCRVIAGRVHRPLENVKEMVGQTGFDSVAGKVGVQGNIEELYLLSPRALLPCFVVIYK
ncbi:hypothetical protein M569_07344, partial [Genlisea aurea]